MNSAQRFFYALAKELEANGSQQNLARTLRALGAGEATELLGQLFEEAPKNLLIH
ncbi:MAG: hypothetical protein AB4040_04135 [Synechococcus sp.]